MLYTKPLHQSCRVVLLWWNNALKLVPGFFFDEKSYLANTFDMEEIFAPNTIEISKSANPFLHIQEIRTLIIGCCYVLTL